MALPQKREAVLAELRAARDRVPDVPESSTSEAETAARPGGLVGRRVLIWWEDDDGEMQLGAWYPGTVVSMSRNRRTLMPYIVHYDEDGESLRWDGVEDDAGPDGTTSIKLLDETVDVCTCPTCLRVHPNTGVRLAVASS